MPGMGRPTSKPELLAAMAGEFEALFAEIDRLTPEQLMAEGACGQWSVKDLLSHLDAWHRMFLSWEEQGRRGDTPAMPAPGYSWSDTPALNDAIWRRTRDDPWDDVLARFRDSHEGVRSAVDGYGDADLFTKRRYPWTGTTSVGSYAVSATSSHYAWARTLIRRFRLATARE